MRLAGIFGVDYYYCYLFIIHLFINLAVIVVMDLDL